MVTTKKWVMNGPGRFRALAERLGRGIRPAWRRVRKSARAMLPVSLAAVALTGCAPPPATSALQQGDALLRQGKPAEALDPLREAISQFGTNSLASAQAWNHLGVAYHYTGGFDLAERAYQNALRKDFNLFAARYNLGCLYLDWNRPAQAVNELSAFVTHEPSDAQGLFRLGTAQLRLRQLEPAEVNLARAAKIAETERNVVLQADALNTLGVVQVLRRKPREAFSAFETSAKAQTNYAAPLLNQAVVAHQYFQDRQLALQRYAAYLAVAPTASQAGQIRAAMQQLDAELRALVPKPAPPQAPPAGIHTNAPAPRAAGPATPVNPGTTAGVGVGAGVGGPPVGTTAGPPAGVKAPLEAVASPPVRTNTVVVAAPPSTPLVVPPARTNLVSTSSTPPQAPVIPSPSAKVVATPPPASSTSPAVNPVTTAKPTATVPQVAVAPKPALLTQVVHIEAEPELKPARDLVPAPQEQRTSTPPAGAQPTTTSTPLPPPQVASAPTAVTSNVPKQVAAAAPAPAPGPGPGPGPAVPTQAPLVVRRQGPVASSATKPEKEKEKRTLLQKVNPLNWFGSKDKSEGKPEVPDTRVVRVSGDGGASQTVYTTTPGPALAIPPPQPQTVKKAAFARYPYRFPDKPVAGDREACMKQLALGIKAHSEGKISDAMGFYEKATEADGTCFEAHYNLGVAAYEVKEFGRALTAGETALALNPGDANARMNFALALDRAGYPVDAAEELETLITAIPNHAQAHFILGNLYARPLALPGRAKVHYEKVLDLEPQHPQANLIRQWLSAHE